MNPPPKPFHWMCECNDEEMSFSDSPSKGHPSTEHIRALVDASRDLHWYYHGMLGVIPHGVVANALAEYDDHLSKRHRREAVPKAVGKFTWGQTLTLEQVYELRRTEAARGSETHE